MRKMSFLWPAMIVSALAFVLTQTFGKPQSVNTSKPENKKEITPGKAEIGQDAPNFNLKDVYGKTFTLSEFKNRIIVLEWLNPACPVSRGKHEAKTMQDTYARYAGKNVIWLGIDSTYTSKAEQDRIYAAEKGLNYPILMDTDGQTGKTYRAQTTPHIFVIDKRGKLVYSGAIDNRADTNYVSAVIEDLLSNRPVGKSKTEPYGCSVKYAR